MSGPSQELSTSTPAIVETRPPGRSPGRSAAVIGCCMVLGVIVFAQVLLTSSFNNDHFMHVVMGQQILQGRLPVRDYLDPGMPLMEAVSALSQWVFGYRLLSEAIIVAGALGITHAVTLWLCTSLTGSLTAGLMLVAPQVMMEPRTYSYPKLVLYAVGILCLWRYLERPQWRARVVLALLVAVAFLMRHDHGLYLGLAAAAAAWFARPRVGVRQRLSETGSLVALIAVAVLPYLAWIQAHGGLPGYLKQIASFTTGEIDTTGRFSLPEWPLRRVSDIVAIEQPPAWKGAVINIAWAERADGQERERVIRTYGLVREGARYRIHDARRETIQSLINEPSVADTAGIDRLEARLDSMPPASDAPQWVIWRGLRTPAQAAGVLFWAFTVLPLIAAGLMMAGLVPPRLRAKAGLVIGLALLTVFGFIRQPVEARIADPVVPQTVLAAACLATVLAVPRSTLVRRVLFAVAVIAALMAFGAVARAAWVIGGVPARLQDMGIGSPVSALPRVWNARLTRLVTSPPIDAWTGRSSSDRRPALARYLQQCTKNDERVLAAWFAPEIYYFANRTFAGRHPFFHRGFWSAPEDVDATVKQLLADRPGLVLIRWPDGFPGGFDAVQAWFAPRYLAIGTVDDEILPITIYRRLDLAPVRTYDPLALPCFR